MMDKCSVFRTGDGLKGLLAKLEGLHERAGRISITDKAGKFNTELLEAVELGHLIALGRVIAVSALNRLESRGAHFREDYPERDDADWLKHTFASSDARAENGVHIAYKPVRILRFEPEERKY
jgi:succinate dehydrogenase / fumarate reductase flavoprotein subunit